MKTSLPIVPCAELAQRIELALAFSLYQREAYGRNLSPVVLPPEIGREYLGVSNLADPPCSLFYRLSGAEREQTDCGTRFGFDTGHILESYVLDLLQVEERHGELSWPYLIAPGGVIKGHFDGCSRTLMEDGPCIIESKATGGYSFGMKMEEGADQGHIEQAFVYATKVQAPYFAVIYSNREAKKSTPFYCIFAYRITDQAAAEKMVRVLFAERFDPVLLSLHHRLRPDQPEQPRHEFGPRGWRCRPDSSYFARGKLQQQVGYCAYRASCPEASAYAQALLDKQSEKIAA